MFRESVTIDAAIALLNEALALDPLAVSALVAARVPCNDALADHPTIQVGRLDEPIGQTVGLIGIISGLFGVDDRGWGAIAAVVDSETGSVERFGRA